MKHLLWIICLGISAIGISQPTTNLVLLTWSGDIANGEFDTPQFLTEFNKNGYDNQPSFMDEDNILFASSYNAVGSTDIYRLSLRDKRLMRMTATEESEYSPVMRGDHFTVVRQEVTEEKQIPQTLWSYPINRSNNGERAIPEYENIGYYRWLPGDRVAMFLLGDPMYMEVYDPQKEAGRFVTNNVGRCFQYDGEKYLYYVVNYEDNAVIRRMDVANDLSQRVTNTLPKSGDYALMDDGRLLSGSGSKLYIYDQAARSGWKEIADFAQYGIKDISRMAIKGNKLVIVVQ